MIDKYPISDTEANILDSHVWAHESFELSKSIVYPTVTENKALSNDYITHAKGVAEKQLVLGGTRLANLLKSFHLKEK